MLVLKICLIIFTLLTILVVFLLNKQISSFFATYWKSCIFSCVILVYVIVFMLVPGIDGWIKYQQDKHGNNWDRSYAISSAFLLQLPCLMSLILPIFLIVDKSRTFAKSVSPFILVYSFMSLLIRFVGYQSINLENTNWYMYIFVGEKNDRFFFMSNYLCLLISLMVLISSRTFTKYSFLGSLFFYISVFTYYLIVVNLKSVVACASGLVKGDWEEIDNSLAMFLPLTGLFKLNDFIWMFNIWLLIYSIVTFILMFLKNFLTINPVKFTFVYKPWYEKYTFLRGFLAPFDAAINNLLDQMLPYGYFFPEPLKKLKLKNFRAYYNGFSVAADMQAYEEHMDQLEHLLTNETNHEVKTIKGGSLKVRKNSNRHKKESDQERRLKELEAAIEQQYNEVDYDEAIRKNKKLEKELRKKAKENNVDITELENDIELKNEESEITNG